MSKPIYSLINKVLPYFMGRRGLITLALGIVGIGAVMNWSWLVAAGVAPVLLAIAPCLVMCGLGLCMNKTSGRSCSSSKSTQPGDGAADNLENSQKFENSQASQLENKDL